MWITLLFLMFFMPIITTTSLLSNCSFNSNIYLSQSAVSNQFQIFNGTSIFLSAYYAFLSSISIAQFELGLIYQFSSNDFLVPFPILLNCMSSIQSCQLKSVTSTSINAESIRVQLTSINYTDVRTSTQSIQMGLYLKQGRYQLSNCTSTINNQQWQTDPRLLFSIDIQYEKSVGSACDSTLDNSCGSSALTRCSSTCTCLSSSLNALVSFGNGSFCADTFNTSNCQIFPSRCVFWCNGTSNSLCICPSDTLKIIRNSLFLCELPVNAKNCSANDTLRRCSLGQCCQQGQCLDCSIVSGASKSVEVKNSFDEQLRIALGVIAGFLGLSAVILFSILCFLRLRHKRRRRQQELTGEKSISPLSSSSTSSLYISPIQQTELVRHDENYSPKKFTRTDSFRCAVLSTEQTTKSQIIERVSTQRDSYVSQKDSCSSPNFSTLEFVLPSTDDYIQPKNVYQIVVPSSTPILTHRV